MKLSRTSKRRAFRFLLTLFLVSLQWLIADNSDVREWDQIAKLLITARKEYIDGHLGIFPVAGSLRTVYFVSPSLGKVIDRGPRILPLLKTLSKDNKREYLDCLELSICTTILEAKRVRVMPKQKAANGMEITPYVIPNFSEGQ